jgi:hypothetical protein
MRRARTRLALLALGCIALISACSAPTGKAERAERDFRQFQREVYPVLLRDCGFPACHGDAQRFFRVWGPGRARLPASDGTLPAAFDVPSGDEISTSYSLAQSMIDPVDPGRSELLRKPLAIDAGGSSHKGADKFGRDVYRTPEDAGYVAIARWVFSAKVEE